MKRLFIIAIIALISISVQAQYTSEGKDFWLSFMGMDSTDRVDVGDDPMQLFLLASSKKACTGTVTNPNTGYTTSFTITPGVVTKIDLPLSQVYCSSEFEVVRVLNKGIHVQSTDTISLYMANYSDASYDATSVLPTQSLGTEYRLLSTSYLYNEGLGYYSDGTTYSFTFDNYASCTVIATEDNTRVRYRLKNSILDNSLTYPSNQDLYKTLNKGQVLYIVSEGMFGVEVESEICKPIAVFSGNYCSNVPYNCRACDLLLEQMSPINTWGTEYIVNSTLPGVNRDSKIQILSLEENTQVVVKSGSSPSVSNTLSVGTELWIDTNVSGGNYITSNKPISVAQYAVGKEFRGIGDPFMLMINPLEQKIKSVVFAPTQTTRISYHYVQIIVETTSTSQTYLDGVNIGSEFSPIIANPFYSVARVLITPSTHELINESGFSAYVYGYGNYESYGYSAGTSMRNTLNDWWVRSPAGQDIDYYETAQATNSYGCGEEFTVSWDIKSPVISIKLLLNGADLDYITGANVATSSRSFKATKLKTGENELTLVLVDQCKSDTMRAKVWFVEPYYQILTPDFTLCENRPFEILAETNLPNNNPTVTYEWTPNSSNLIATTLTSASGISSSPMYYKSEVKCDNKYSFIDSVKVSIIPSVLTHVYDTICANESYQFYGETYTQAGQYSHADFATNSCDSNIVLHLSVLPVLSSTQTITFNWGDTIKVHGNIYTQVGEFTDKLVAITGCDSMVTTKIVFDYMTCPDLVAPKYFTPNADGVNDLYHIENIECFSKAYIEIYDRYGKLLVKNLSEDKGWDGNYLTEPMPTTDYWFVIVIPETGKRHVGHFTLVR